MNIIFLDLLSIWKERLIWMGIGAGITLFFWIYTSIRAKRKRRQPMKNLKKKAQKKANKWKEIGDAGLEKHNQKVKELTSSLLLKCARLLEGEFAEEAFIYYLWESKGGKKDQTKDWEFKKLIEKGQDTLKMIFTSFNNLTITSIELHNETADQIGTRWERLFVWIRGNRQEIIRLDEDQVEDFFNITQFVAPFVSKHIKKEYPLDIEFMYLTPKQVSQEYNDLLGKIAEMKNYIEKLEKR